MSGSWKPNPAFVELFARRRELFIAGLSGVAASLPQLVCKPIDQDFAIGWVLEQGHTGHPSTPSGDIGMGLNYLRHMINQGFVVAYAVSLSDGGTVHLQAWELPHDQKPWPDDPEIVFTSIWRPILVQR